MLFRSEKHGRDVAVWGGGVVGLPQVPQLLEVGAARPETDMMERYDIVSQKVALMMAAPVAYRSKVPGWGDSPLLLCLISRGDLGLLGSLLRDFSVSLEAMSSEMSNSDWL